MSAYLSPCPFCGGPVRLVYDGTADGTCYGVSHRPGACSILPTVWGAVSYTHLTLPTTSRV